MMLPQDLYKTEDKTLWT